MWVKHKDNLCDLNQLMGNGQCSHEILKLRLKGAGRMIQVVKRLPSKCEALSSNPSTLQKKVKTE
jgi:hypothetical protein